MSEEMYGLTLDPGSDGYSAGPTPDVKDLLGEKPGPTVPAEIHLLRGDGENVPVYKWRGYGWDRIADPFEVGPGASLVLAEAGIEPRDGGVLMVSCKVEQFTVEAKVKPADYEQARGYVSILPHDLWVHVPVHDPHKLVDEAGDVAILGQVYRYIAQELDMAVFDQASRRMDRRTEIADKKAARKGGVSIGKTVPKKDIGEVL